MPIIKLKASMSGYIRGYETREVEVTEEELTRIKSGEYDDYDLSEIFYDGKQIDSKITRNNTEWCDFELIKEK